MLRRALLLLALGAAIPAEAVTIRDIIELSKAGLPDTVLTAVIDADRTIFTLDAPQILELKKAGVSEAVLLKMLRSRAEFEPPPAPEPPQAPQEIAPHVVIIGGSAGREDTRGPAEREFMVPQYYYVPFPIWGRPAPRIPTAAPAPFLLPEHRGFGRFINDGWIGRP